MSDRTILILAASAYQVDAILTAKRLGYRVVTADNVPENPGHALADVSYNVSTLNRDEILTIAWREKVHGVISPATDVAVPTLAYVAEKMKLPGPTQGAAEILCDKVNFRNFLAWHGLPCPRSYTVQRAEDVRPTPLDGTAFLIKPDRSSGGKGIVIVRTFEEYRDAFAEAKKYALGGRALLEEFIEGFQGTLEGLFIDGRLVRTFFLDRQTFSQPYVTTTGHRVPTRLSEKLQKSVIEQVGEIFKLLDVESCPFDCDFVATENEAFILEVTPRTGGNSIARLLKQAFDFDILEASIKLACNDLFDPGDDQAIKPAGVVLFGVDNDGALKYNVKQLALLQKEPWVAHIQMDAAPGSEVKKFINGRCRLGEALVTGKDRTEVDARIAELNKRLAITSAKPEQGE